MAQDKQKNSTRMATHDIDWRNPEEKRLREFVVQQYESGKERRQNWEQQAAEQLSYARGNQHLRWDNEKNSLAVERDALLGDRFPITVNELRPFLFSWISMVVSRPITWKARPRTAADADVLGARLQSRLLQHYWREERVLRNLIDGLWMMYCTGIDFIKVTWDPYLGPKRSIPKGQVQEIADGLGIKPPGMDLEGDDYELPEGDLNIEFVSGFELTEPASAKNIEEAQWLIHSRFVPVEDLRAQYPKKKDIIKPVGAEELDRFRVYEDRVEHTDYSGNERDGDGPTDVALVHELWRPKSRAVPAGYLCVCTEEGVLTHGPHPYRHGKLPFIDMRECPDPQFFRPGCSIRDMMGTQRANNRIRSQAYGHFDRTVDPHILHEPSAGLPPGAFVDPGPKVIQVNEGGLEKIKPWVAERPPEAMWRLLELGSSDLSTVGRLHLASQGSADFAKQSGAHARTMQLADTASHALTRLFVEDALKRAGQQCVQLLWEKVSEKRSTPMRGLNNEPELLEWSGKQLVAETMIPVGPYAPSVEVSLAPDDNAGEAMQKVEVLTKMGWMTPENPDDRIRVMRWMGEDGAEDDDESAQHRANAAEEHQSLLGGVQLFTRDGDDDLIHIYEHRMFQTRDQFKVASAQNPAIVKAISDHILAHEWNFALKRMRPLALMEAAKLTMATQYGLIPTAPGAEQGQEGQTQSGATGGPPTPPAPTRGVASGASSEAASGTNGRPNAMNGRR